MTSGKIWLDRDALRAHLQSLRSGGRTLVTACGCFELLHVGHVRYLEAAKGLGDFLVVAVNTDDSIARIKPGREPVNPDHERFELLAALEAVDFVTPLGEDTPVELLQALRPEIHAKGTDYRLEDIPERPLVESYGGRVATVGDRKTHSTTDMLRTIADRSDVDESTG